MYRYYLLRQSEVGSCFSVDSTCASPPVHDPEEHLVSRMLAASDIDRSSALGDTTALGRVIVSSRSQFACAKIDRWPFLLERRLDSARDSASQPPRSK